MKKSVLSLSTYLPSLAICIFVTTGNLLYGQSANIVPPTPNAQKITEFQSQHPNLYTGTASVGIPLYTIDFDGMKLPITLTYNATGIRTNEEASEVGLGWALNATGVISRTVQGGDDLFQGTNANGRKGYVYNDLELTFSSGYDWKTDPVPDQDSYYYKLAQQGFDTEPDIFNYNFFGYSGSFVLSQKVSSNNQIAVIKLTEDATRVSFDEATQTFSIYTPDGFRGEFTVTERSSSFSSIVPGGAIDRMSCCDESNIDILYYENVSGTFRTSTSWYLSKISSPRGEEILFTYDLNSDGSSPYLSQSKAFGELESILSPDVCLQTVHEHVYLKQIISDEIRLDFVMEDREDLRENTLFVTNGPFPQSQPLKRFSQINLTAIHPSSTFEQTIILTQGYFNQQYEDRLTDNRNEDEFQWLRSRLDKVTIGDQVYRFYYEDGTKGLPNKLTTGIDHFGFYNGKDENTQLLPPGPVNSRFEDGSENLGDTTLLEYYRQNLERAVDIEVGKAGVLKKVRYPTQGYTTFEFEEHTYLPETDGYFLEATGQKKAGGLRIASIKEYDYWNTLLRSRSYRYSEGPDDPPNSQISTGRLMTPLYNRYARIYHNPDPPYNPTGFTFMHQAYSTIPGNSSAEGKIIGYSKVHEMVEGDTESYRNTYYFENRPNRVLAFNAIAVGYPNLNGQIKETRNYNDEDKIVQLTINEDYNHPLDSIKAIRYKSQGVGSTYLDYFVPYTLKRSFNVPYRVVTIEAGTSSGIVENSNGTIQSWGQTLTTTKDLEYSASFLLKSEQRTNSKGEITKTQSKRIEDYPQTSDVKSFMLDKHLISPIIEEIQTIAGTIVSAAANRYEIQYGRLNLTETYTFNPDRGSFLGSVDGVTFYLPCETETRFELYDEDTGRLLQYTSEDGVTNSFLWGYNGKLPIAHGVGISHADLLTAHLDAGAAGDYNEAIRNHANLQGKLVTTFEHDPLVGVTAVFNTVGQKTGYEYDVFNRLQKIVDHKGRTVEQYSYHFSTPTPTRTIEISGNLDFGTITPDFFTDTSLPYEKCSDGLTERTITISNTGEDDLTVSSISLPPGFTSQWAGGIIHPGSSVNNTIYFNQSETLALGNYGGTISLSSNKTSGTAEVEANAVYANRACDFALSATVVDFGIVTGNFANQSLVLTNNGNATLKLIGVPLDWDGTVPGATGDYSDYQHPDFKVLIGATCIDPGQSLSIPIVYEPKATGQSETKLSLIFDQCSALRDIVTIKGDKRPLYYTSIIDLTPSPLTFPAFTTATASQTLTVTNQGNYELSVHGVISSNPLFTVSPTEFQVPPNGGTTEVTVTFNPGAYNFSQEATTLTFNGDQTSGTNVVNASGQRTRIRMVELQPDQLAFEPPLFTYQNVTVRNTGNDLIEIQGPSHPNTADWSTTIDNVPFTIAPNGTTILKIMQLTPDAEELDIRVAYSGTVSTDFVHISAVKRVIGISPATLRYPSFTTATASQTVTVTNTGNATLTVNSISSSNPKFSASPSSFTVAPNGGSTTVTVTFDPGTYNFSQESTTLTFAGDQTSGTSTLTATGQRTRVRNVELLSDELVFEPPLYTYQYVTIKNTGNDLVVIEGASHPNTPNWSATIDNTPVSVAPGNTTFLKVMQLSPDAEDIDIKVAYNGVVSNDYVTAKAIKRIISIVPQVVSYPSFTGTSASQQVTVTNSGNSTLNVSGISSSNTRFTASPNSFSLSPAAQQIVSITYTPTDFTVQSSTMTFNGDATSGDNSITVSAQRTQSYSVSVYPLSLVIKSSAQVQSAMITNSGNVNATINAVSNSNPAAFGMSVLRYQSATWVSASLPFTLTPGQQLKVEIRSADGYYWIFRTNFTTLPTESLPFIPRESLPPTGYLFHS